ncbi:MAG: hypothetical protein KF900_01325 [Bacteroidetes bacterium]|nr:hypothetical protein [Bacteroidota bacterium]
MRKSFIYLFSFSLFVFTAQAQNFLRLGDWKKYRKEVFGGVGTSNFLGDLGGGNTTGRDYSPADLNFSTTRMAISAGGRYKLERWLNVGGKLSYLAVRGDDKLSTEISRQQRNLNFKSNIFELTGRVEAGWQKNRVGGTKYSNHSYKRLRGSGHSIYGFIGIGAFYFNPKGKAPDGKYVKLRPLHTEGQGLPDGPKQYSRISVAIPVGVYYKYHISNVWTVGAEFSIRKTFTDYIDDVGGVYYDSTALANNYGVLAAQMADPNIYPKRSYTRPAADGTRAIRGDKQKDVYMSLEITLSYTFKEKRRLTRLRSKF